MHLFIVAGEASGDLLAASLIKALRNYWPDIRITGIAGPQMRQAGCEVFHELESISIMGIVEVVKHIPSLLAIRKRVINYCLANKPDLYIGVDAPDFNLGIELRLKIAGIKTVHYTSPTIWAWRSERIHTIAKAVDLMLTLFPFEQPFYQQHGIKACYVGHPLADQIPFQSDKLKARQSLKLQADSTIIGLLPGSRSSEIKYLAPIFLKTAKRCLEHKRDIQFIIPLVNQARRRQFEEIVSRFNYSLPLHLIDGQAQLSMAAADCLLIASGTATLEAMLIKRPMVVAYRVAAITYQILKRKVKLKQFALPNILSGKELIPEFIQNDAKPENLSHALLNCLTQPELNKDLMQEFTLIHEQLKCNGSERAAKAIYDFINDSSALN